MRQEYFPRKKQLSIPTATWDKPADLFWLGSDLETTAQTALRGAPKERIRSRIEAILPPSF